MASIVSIVYQPAGQDRHRSANCFLRMALAEATLRTGHGIEGDAKAGRHPLRQLNLLSQEWLSERAQEGFDTTPGAFGEQIVIQGIAVEALQPGDHLQLGAEAEIEITQPRSGCRKLQAVQGMGTEAAWDQVGVLARVITGGTIRIGDSVCVRSLTTIAGSSV